LELLVQSASHPVRQIQFRSSLGPSYVTASRGQISSTVNAFLHGGAATDKLNGRAPKKNVPARRDVALSSATASEAAEEHGLAATVPFKVYYPIKRVTTAGAPLDQTRFYRLNGHPAYVVV